MVKLKRTKAGYSCLWFEIRKTDNANARAIGLNPKWTLTDTITGKYKRYDTLGEIREFIEKVAAEASAGAKP